MSLRIGTIALLVTDYDEAIAFYCGPLGFRLIEDTPLGGGKRWVVVGPEEGGVRLLLAKAIGAEQTAAIGRQAGGRVGFFLETDDFAATRARFEAAGVRFLEATREERYGIVAVFEDLYGNRWDLVEPVSTPSRH